MPDNRKLTLEEQCLGKKLNNNTQTNNNASAANISDTIPIGNKDTVPPIKFQDWDQPSAEQKPPTIQFEDWDHPSQKQNPSNIQFKNWDNKETQRELSSQMHEENLEHDLYQNQETPQKDPAHTEFFDWDKNSPKELAKREKEAQKNQNDLMKFLENLEADEVNKSVDANKSNKEDKKPNNSIEYRRGFIPQHIIELAQEGAKNYKIPASVTIAQWILESAYGTRMPKDSNNPFGIKEVNKNAKASSATTHEEIKGKKQSRYKTVARFKIFKSIDDAFEYHGKWLSHSRYYKSAMKHTDDPEKFLEEMSKVYATDNSYYKKVKTQINHYNLYQYDNQ